MLSIIGDRTIFLFLREMRSTVRAGKDGSTQKFEMDFLIKLGTLKLVKLQTGGKELKTK